MTQPSDTEQGNKDKPQRDYPVGYGRPPKHTRFKKGQSGNRKGRPKGSRNIGKLMVDALAAKIEVVENGRRIKLPKGEVAARQIANKAAGGDIKAFNAVTEVMRKTGQLEEVAVPTTLVFDERDMRAVSQLLQFFVTEPKNTAGGDDESEPA
jgi:hypothetical protein